MVYGRAALAQTLDGRVDIVGKQADMLEALFPVWVGGWSAGKDLDKAVARDVEVDEHERAVVVVQPEGLFDTENSVEAEGGVYVVDRE